MSEEAAFQPENPFNNHRSNDFDGTDRDQANPDLMHHLKMQVVGSMGTFESEDQRTIAIAGLITASEQMGPVDPLEKLLISQMFAVHETGLEALRRAALPQQASEGRNADLGHAAKLLQLWTRQLEALHQHRQQRARRVSLNSLESCEKQDGTGTSLRIVPR
jgi:hypothetical protein